MSDYCKNDCTECTVTSCSWHEEMEWLRRQQEEYANQTKLENDKDDSKKD